MNNEYIDTMNASFGIDSNLSFVLGENGIPVACIDNSLCSAEISIYGAHILSYNPAGFDDLLWVSKKSIYKDGTPIRGGIPICWPWFGSHPLSSSYYSHGFARRKPWQVIATKVTLDGAVQITMLLDGPAVPSIGWPIPFRAELTVIAGSSLTVSLKTYGCAESEFLISNALHTYFSVSDISAVSVEGLAGCEYGDDVDNRKIKKELDVITFNSEVDRNYRNTTADCTIIDTGKKRKIIISKKGSATTVVWNPWIEKSFAMADFGDEEYREMLCVEAVNAFNDTITIKPGSVHEITQVIRAVVI